MAGALIEGIDERVALGVPAQVVEVGVELPAQAEIEGEFGEGLPVVFREEAEVGVVVVGQHEGRGGCGAAQSDREEQIVVVDLAILVAIEVGEVFDGLNVALLKDAEVEVGIDGLHLTAEAEGVLVQRPSERVVALEAELAGLLRDAVGCAVVEVGIGDLRGGGDGIGDVDEVVVGEAELVDDRGREDVDPVGDEALQVVGRGLSIGGGAEGAVELALAEVVF